jgi:uncharacterized protein
MQRILLGQSGLSVSKLCYGTLTLSSTQSNKTPREGGELIAYALDRGVCFLDTAQLYDTYFHIREALKQVCALPVISTKSYAYDKHGAKESVEQARREMNVDVIDLFMLHEQETLFTMQGHSEALRYYLRMRDLGVIRAVGISTHAIEPIQVLLKSRKTNFEGKYFPRVNDEVFDEGLFREIDVVHPILNLEGIGLLDGNAKEMEQVVKAASKSGVGVFGMKILGGGNLLPRFDDAIDYALNMDYVHSFAVGMQSREEIDLNINLFKGQIPDRTLIDAVKKVKRRILVENWCTGCGECLKVCAAQAISLKHDKATVDPSRCILCSYCARHCTQFALKVV